MFCPKCGMQGGDDTRFCRGCGADVGGVLAVVEGKPVNAITPADEKYVELYSRGIRGLLLAAGFFIVAGVSFAMSERAMAITLFSLMFAFAVLAAGISRFVQARGLKKLHEKAILPSLPAREANYLDPPRSIYDTDDLAPASVTERTTNLLSAESKRER